VIILTKQCQNKKVVKVSYKSKTLTKFLLIQKESKNQRKRVNPAIIRSMILFLVEKGFFASQIAGLMEISKQKVSYHLRILENSGAVIRQANTKPIFYILGSGITPKLAQVKKTLIGHEPTTKAEREELKGLLKPMLSVNTHSAKIRLDVIKGQLPLLRNTYEVKNWKRSQAQITIDNIPVKVFFNHTKTPNVIIQSPAIYGRSAVENEARMLFLGQSIKRYYEQRIIGLELSSPTLVDRDHQVDEPVISSEIDKGRFSVNGLWTDHTPTAGIESKDALTIEEYLAMPKKVALLEQKIDLLQKTIAQQTTLIERLLTPQQELKDNSKEMFV
jgi:hypothetical protein